MGRIKLILFFTLIASGLAQAQVNRYMVFFHDKSGTPYSISSPETFLSNRSIQRRSDQNISIVEQDLPVAPTNVTTVRNIGVTVLYKTKWMNGVLVECDASMISTITALSCVSSVTFVAPGSRPSPDGRKRSSTKFNETAQSEGFTDVQISMLGMDAMHAAGFRGEGKLIAILDAGFPGADTISYFKHVFNDGRFDAATSYDFVSGGSNVFSHHFHGTNVWSLVAGFKQNVFVGGAPKANFILFVTEDAGSEYPVEEYNWLFAAERADSAGVDVINTSLGYRTFDDASMNYSVSDMDGQTAVISRAAEIASSKGMAVIVSAGNEGNGSPTTIGAPADAESVLSVGAVTSEGVIASFSSIGPTSDGRIKPDVAALGTLVAVVRPNGTISGTGAGTSFAGPLVASLVADVWQMHPDLTVDELFDNIRASANQFSHPDNFLGYGIPNFSGEITATKAESNPEFVTVYPNPVLHNLRVTLREADLLKDLVISIFDSKGMSCNVAISTSSEELVLDFSSQKPGLYLLRLQNGSKVSIHKILKIE